MVLHFLPTDTARWSWQQSRLLEFTHAILACHIIFKMTISDYTVPEELMRYPLSLSAVGLLSGVIIFSAQVSQYLSAPTSRLTIYLP